MSIRTIWALATGAAVSCALSFGAKADLYTMGVTYGYGQDGDTSISINGFGDPWTTPVTMTSKGSTLIVYCDDLFHDFYPGRTYNLTPGSVTTDSIGHALTAAQSSEMGLIADLGRADYLKGDSAGAIAAQAAIWSVEYFYGEASSKKTVFSSDPVIEGDIRAFLNLPINPDGHYASGFIIHGEGQSQIWGSPAVPEPSTWAMMALGFVAMGYAGLRKQRARRPARCAF